MIRSDEHANQTPVLEPAPTWESGSAAGKRRPVSILHLYSGNLYGGIETMLATLARSQALEPNLRMEYALCFPGRLRDELQATGATVHDLGPVKTRHPWTVIRARRRLRNLLASRPFDLVMTHACWPHALFASTARQAGHPVVFWQHDFVGSGHWVERLASRTQPDYIISNSHASAATLPRLFPGVPGEVVYCPVSPPEPMTEPAAQRATIRHSLDTREDAVVIIQTSRLERWKGQSLLLDALGRLRDHPEWIAWIVGGAQRPREHEYLAQLKTQAARSGIADRVRFLGQRSDVPHLLAAADIHCQPNLEPEPFGIAFIEALYAGLPVVSTRMGGAAEIVTEECGILVETGDAVALAMVLHRLIDHPADRFRLGRTAPMHAAILSDPGRLCSHIIKIAGKLIM